MNDSSQKVKLSLGLILLLVGVMFVFGKQPKVPDLSSSFAQEPVKVQGFSLNESLAREPVRVIIPKLSIDLEINKSKIIDGYWEVHEDTAGWGEGSGVPGEDGNQVIFAHAREGLFLPLKSIEEKSSIYILSESIINDNEEEVSDSTSSEATWYEYEVTEIKEVLPNQTEVIAPTTDETLTLYTCSGFGDRKRLIVVAKRTV